MRDFSGVTLAVNWSALWATASTWSWLRMIRSAFDAIGVQVLESVSSWSLTPNRCPGRGDLVERSADSHRAAKSSIGSLAFLKVLDVGVDRSARVLEPGEGILVAGDGILGLHGKLLRLHLDIGHQAAPPCLAAAVVGRRDVVREEHHHRRSGQDDPESGAPVAGTSDKSTAHVAHDSTSITCKNEPLLTLRPA